MDSMSKTQKESSYCKGFDGLQTTSRQVGQIATFGGRFLQPGLKNYAEPESGKVDRASAFWLSAG